MSTPRSVRAVVAVTAIGLGACAPAPFERYISQGRWSDAVTAFGADSSLMNNEQALYDAGTLFSSPVRGAYDPQRAQLLLRRLLSRFPATPLRLEAADRLALVDAVVREHDSTSAREHVVEGRIAQLTAETRRLRSALDSLTARNDVLEKGSAKMEADLRDRDEQLRALRLELARLKEIDLKPRPGTRPPR